MQETRQEFGRAIIGPAGEVRYCHLHEHSDEAEAYLRGRGEDVWDASSQLDSRGWIRMPSQGRITTLIFGQVERLTQAQRDVLFDMAMHAQEEGRPWIAERIMADLERIPD